MHGNRTQQTVTVAGTPSTTSYSYNAANQMTSDGSNTLTYDANGNLTGDGVNSYTWDRANRLLTTGGYDYTYDGLGNRITSTVGGVLTRYLLDMQLGLTQVIAATTGSDTTRYLHAPRGIHAQQSPAGTWTHLLQDGLGSVRGVVSDALAVQEARAYTPYGEPISGAGYGYDDTSFGFTGEQSDANDLLFLRARYYAPGRGTFTALDPVEGGMTTPMTLNRYAYVGGNPITRTDASGMFWTQFAQQRTQLLNSYVSTQTQRLSRHINRATQWLGWVNGVNSCGTTIPMGGLDVFHINQPVNISANPTLVASYQSQSTQPLTLTIPQPNNPCDDHLQRIKEAIAELYRRAEQQITNYCKLWEIAQGIIVEQPSECENVGTWGGHQDQMRGYKRNLRTHLGRFNNSGRDGCPDDDGNINGTAAQWLAFDTDALLPKDVAEDQGIVQELPPVLASDLHIPSTACPFGFIQLFGQCIPIIIYFA